MPAGGEIWCQDLIHFKMGKPLTCISQPRLHISRPVDTGVTISDSSLKRLVDSPAPRCHKVPPRCPIAYEQRKSREVWVFAMPSLTVLPEANQHMVSSMIIFWRLYGGATNKFRTYIVPQKDSVPGAWCSAKRERLAEAIFSASGVDVQILPTVREILTELGISEVDAYIEDGLHMTKDATKKVHKGYWIHINASDDIRPAAEVPILVWDNFNASEKHLAQAHGRHVQFWRLFTTWCKAESYDKASYVQQINAMLKSPDPLAQAVWDQEAHVLRKWYCRSRNSVFKYRTPSMKKAGTPAATLDESMLDASDESDLAWCPGWMAGGTTVDDGWITSRSLTDADSKAGKWESTTRIDFWRELFVALMNKVMTFESPAERLEHNKNARGEWKLSYAAIARMYTVEEDGRTFYDEYMQGSHG